MKNLNAKFLIGSASFSTPFKEAENRFSIFCLVCATELTKYIRHMEKSMGEVYIRTFIAFTLPRI